MISVFEAEDLKTLKLIGSFRNNWRQRLVRVYEHPTDTSLVVSAGYPYQGGPPNICVEKRTDYASIEASGWRTYN